MRRMLVLVFVLLLAIHVGGCGGGGGGSGGKNGDLGGNTQDTTSPRVSFTSPINNTTGVLSNTTITLTFNEDMNASTINENTFTISGVSGSVTYNNKVATFTPTSVLDDGTTYTATITSDAEDLAGNSAISYSWSFTTYQLVQSGLYDDFEGDEIDENKWDLDDLENGYVSLEKITSDPNSSQYLVMTSDEEEISRIVLTKPRGIDIQDYGTFGATFMLSSDSEAETVGIGTDYHGPRGNGASFYWSIGINRWEGGYVEIYGQVKDKSTSFHEEVHFPAVLDKEYELKTTAEIINNIQIRVHFLVDNESIGYIDVPEDISLTLINDKADDTSAPGKRARLIAIGGSEGLKTGTVDNVIATYEN